MSGWAMASVGATGAAVTVAVLSLLWTLGQRPKRNADVLFALVCGSMAMSLMQPWVTEAPIWMRWAMAIGGCLTCNGVWLVSRALFRGEAGVGRVQVGIAATMAALIIAYRGLTLDASEAQSPWASVLGALLVFGGSAMLVLSFLEAARGWSSQWPEGERRLRLGFMVLFAGCVLSAKLVGALVEQGSLPAEIRGAVVGICATLMLGYLNLAMWYRRRNPLALPVAQQLRPSSSPPTSPKAEDTQLAQALRHHLEVLQVYREPELKVAVLAERMGTSEHKLSRVITQVLGERNFNQMLNRYRIEHACRLLSDANDSRSVLDISGDCGFASLGPFNRAFKAALGCPPSVWRARQREQAERAHAAELRTA